MQIGINGYEEGKGEDKEALFMSLIISSPEPKAHR